MPIYEYKCEKCCKEFEELVFNDQEAVPCPACTSTDTRKLMSACRHKHAGGAAGGGDDGGGGGGPSFSSGGGGCSGCSGGSCATCK